MLTSAACSPSAPEELLAAARTAVAASDMRTAEIHLKNLVRADSRHVEARVLLGNVLLVRGDAAGAVQQFNAALSLGADAATVRLPLLRGLLAQREYQAVLEQTAALPPGERERALVLATQAAAHRGLGELDQAENAYRRALELEPSSSALKTDLADVLFQRQRLADAAELLEQVLAADAEFVPAVFLRAAMALAAGRHSAAAEEFRRAAELARVAGGAALRFAARERLVETLLGARATAEALTEATALLADNPTNPAAQFIMARVEVEQGELESAEQRLESLVADYPDADRVYLLLGAVTARRGRLGQAEMYLRAAANRRPDDAAAQLLLAEVYLRRGNVDAARALLARPETSSGSDALLFALAGRSSLQAGQSGLADQYFERAERTVPRTLSEFVSLASVYVAAGEFNRAVRLLQTAALNEPGSEQVISYMLALAHLQAGGIEEARTQAAKLLAANPEAAYLHSLHGSISAQAGEHDKARGFYTRALELDPRHLPALLGRARLAYAGQDYDGAAAELTRAIEIDPRYSDAILGMVQLALTRGDFADADRWLAMAPESAARAHLEGEAHLARNRVELAAAAYSRAFGLAPSLYLALKAYVAARQAGAAEPERFLVEWSVTRPRDIGANLALGSVALERGDVDAATSRYESVIAVDPDNVTALNNLAWILGERGDDRALVLAERAYRLRPMEAAVLDTLGWLHVRRGAPERGLPLLEQAVAAAPNHAEIRYHRAIALADSGAVDPAIGELRSLLGGEPFPARAEAEARLAALEGRTPRP